MPGLCLSVSALPAGAALVGVSSGGAHGSHAPGVSEDRLSPGFPGTVRSCSSGQNRSLKNLGFYSVLF